MSNKRKTSSRKSASQLHGSRAARKRLDSGDLELLARLMTELPGIANWAREGWDDLQKRGRFVRPRSTIRAALPKQAASDPATAPVQANGPSLVRDLQEAIRCVVAEKGSPTLADLTAELEGRFELEGPELLTVNAALNLVAWDGMGKEYRDALVSLLQEKELEMVRCDPLQYVVGGWLPDLPLDAFMLRPGYDGPVWVPVLLRAGPEFRRQSAASKRRGLNRLWQTIGRWIF